MTSEVIRIGDPVHTAAMAALDAMHDFWNLRPFNGSVQWIEDTSGRVVIFTRSEYRERLLRAAVNENMQPIQQFEIEHPNCPLEDEQEESERPQ